MEYCFIQHILCQKYLVWSSLGNPYRFRRCARSSLCHKLVEQMFGLVVYQVVTNLECRFSPWHLVFHQIGKSDNFHLFSRFRSHNKSLDRISSCCFGLVCNQGIWSSLHRQMTKFLHRSTMVVRKVEWVVSLGYFIIEHNFCPLHQVHNLIGILYRFHLYLRLGSLSISLSHNLSCYFELLCNQGMQSIQFHLLRVFPWYCTVLLVKLKVEFIKHNFYP